MKQKIIGLACVLTVAACNKASDKYPNNTAIDHTKNSDYNKKADNTGINERDRANTLTPLDQGNSEAETRITAAIREGLMGDPTLSITAKNVKVITVGKKVTLRGPALSDQEKATIGALAQRTAGVNEVDNLLEVKK